MSGRVLGAELGEVNLPSGPALLVLGPVLLAVLGLVIYSLVKGKSS